MLSFSHASVGTDPHPPGVHFSRGRSRGRECGSSHPVGGGVCIEHSVVRSCALVSGNSNCSEETEEEEEDLAESEGGRGVAV